MLKSSAAGAADVAHVEIDVAGGWQQRGIDEQPADVDAFAVAGLRDLKPMPYGLRAGDQRVDVRELVAGEPADVSAGVRAAVVRPGQRRDLVQRQAGGWATLMIDSRCSTSSR